MNTYFFSHGRTAFKYGLVSVKFASDNVILLPDYICDSILIPLRQIGIRIKYYSVNDDFSPNWYDLKKHIDHNVKALLMIHYFGQPQRVEDFLDFCSNNNLILIEDNAHGHGGVYKEQLMGTFGDIGISSPRKNYPIAFGGVLFIKSQSVIKHTLPAPPLTLQLRKTLKRKLSNISFVKSILSNRPVIDQTELSRDEHIPDWSIDKTSLNVLLNADHEKIKFIRRRAYLLWKNCTLERGLKPVFNTLYEDCIPWVYPAYAATQIERDRWLDWGFKNNINIQTWPALPLDVVEKSGAALKRWQRLLCFPIDHRINIDKLHDCLNHNY